MTAARSLDGGRAVYPRSLGLISTPSSFPESDIGNMPHVRQQRPHTPTLPIYLSGGLTSRVTALIEIKVPYSAGGRRPHARLDHDCLSNHQSG